MNECDVNDESCQYATKRDNVTQEISHMKEELTECREEYVKNIENQTKFCYEDLIQRMEDKLVKYLPTIQNCENLRDEDQLFHKMGLVNFTQQEFLVEDELTESQSPHPLNSTGVEENHKLQYRISDYLMQLNQYTYHLRYEMRRVFDGFKTKIMTDYDAMVDKIGNERFDKRLSCFNRTATELRYSLNQYYSDKVHRVCFEPLPEFLFNATIITGVSFIDMFSPLL